MSNPSDVSKDSAPIEVHLEAGKQYYWCSCGRSRNQPFCDGAHKGTGFEPKAFSVDEAKSVWLCACKKSANAPFCDGAHSKA